MKRHLAKGGGWLAGAAGLTALGYLATTEAMGGRHPTWPYLLFTAMIAGGLGLYFRCQEPRQLGAATSSPPEAASPGLGQSRETGDARTALLDEGASAHDAEEHSHSGHSKGLLLGAGAVVAAVLLAGVFSLALRGGAGPAARTTHDAQIVLRDPGSEGVRGVAFSYDYKYLAAADGNGRTYLWALPSDKIYLRLRDPGSKGANAVAFPPNDTMNATADGNGHIYLWAGTHYTRLTDPASKGVNAVAFTPNSKYLAAGDANGHTYIWDMATHKIVANLPDPDSKGVRGVAFTPNGKFLAAGDVNGDIYISNLSHIGV
jgi:WD domain, G-beta repeat